MQRLNAWRSFGGSQQVWQHQSRETGTAMAFALFLPPGPGPHPLLWFLSGLTCTHANVMEKGQYQRLAAELGIAVLCPDTSPRGEGVADDPAYDLGQGAGFYLDATQAPWAANFRMKSYLLHELAEIAAQQFPLDLARQAITGHSMGGHGALTLALSTPGRFASVSAFSPIVAPSKVPWGERAFAAYLGEDRALWEQHDAVALIEAGARLPALKVDQGAADPFLDSQLQTDRLAHACADTGIALELGMHDGYDHSYYFIASFMDAHLRFHARHLFA
jgi:S-formylglutathione hydrolase